MSQALKKSMPTLDDLIIERISAMIQKMTGVQLGDNQRQMVESRLRKRMIDLNIPDFQQYMKFLESHHETESSQLVSLLTTHHTFFFREFNHFEYLQKEGLARIIKDVLQRPDRTLRVWSAACSRGQEVYSLAMFLSHHLPKFGAGIKFEIVGSDVDPESVAIAKNGVYHRNEIKEVPLMYLGNHWIRGTGNIADYVKVKSTLRSSCHFESVNLFDFNHKFYQKKYDLIFCRNVFIYFNNEQIKSISEHLLSSLNQDGLLFLGISESLTGQAIKCESLGQSIYSTYKEKTQSIQKVPSSYPNTQKVVSLKDHHLSKASPSPLAESSSLLKVFCIDDSHSIHTLMKQILKKENGFEIVGHALNGKEAMEKLKGVKADVITLDIHMPEMDGLQYLEKNFGPHHPAVVMVTSVSRENADLAMKALALGASDYVEKPALSNMQERGDEIRTKLRVAHEARLSQNEKPLALDKAFTKQEIILNPSKKLRIIHVSFSDKVKIKNFIRELDSSQPPTYILFEGVENALAEFARQLNLESSKRIEYISEIKQLHSLNQILIGDAKKIFPELKKIAGDFDCSMIIFGQQSQASSERILSWKNAHKLLEDLGPKTSEVLRQAAADVVPATSFAYMSHEFLARKKT